MDKEFTIIGICAVLLGLLFVGITLVLFAIKVRRITKSTKTTGVVMNVEARPGMRQSHSSTRNTLYKPTVRFQTADGRVVDYTPNTSNSWSNYRVGENVPVHYDPQQLQKVFIGTTFRLLAPFLIFGFIGGLFTLVGAFFVFISRGLSS